MQGIGIILLYVVIIGAFYLIAIRPQKKKEKEHQALVNAVAVSDSILTTSGFYGVVIDMTDEVVIVGLEVTKLSYSDAEVCDCGS